MLNRFNKEGQQTVFLLFLFVWLRVTGAAKGGVLVVCEASLFVIANQQYCWLPEIVQVYLQC